MSSENQWKKSSRKKDEITVAIVTMINAKVDYFSIKKEKKFASIRIYSIVIHSTEYFNTI